MVLDDFLHQDRLYQLSKDETEKYRCKDGLSRKTKGYQYYCTLKAGSSKIGPIKRPETKYTIHNEYNLGQVDSLWVVTSSSDKTDRTLKERCKERMDSRALNKSASFHDFVSLRTSCYILEEKNGIFFCDCWEGMKGKQCKHSLALMFYTEKWVGEADVRSVPLGKTRKPGRPKKNPHCLTKSPEKGTLDSPEVANDEEIKIEDSSEPLVEPGPSSASAIPLRRSTRRLLQSADLVRTSTRNKRGRAEVEEEDEVEDIPQLLGNSKPPRKKAKQSERGKGRKKTRGK